MERHLLRVEVALRVGDRPGAHETNERKQSKSTERGDFTGKLVKSLLIDGNPGLRRFFEKEAGDAPKLVHVTPLYAGSGKVRCVHSLGDVGDGRYAFYVGFVESGATASPSYDDVYRALLDLSGRHRFRDRVLDVELMSVETLDVVGVARSLARSLTRAGKLKVVFASPTLLRDPFRAGKHKSLTPTTMNIFSTPVYINLYLAGRLRQRPFLRTLVTLHRLLNEPYSALRTAKVIKLRYDERKSPIPALIGYVNLFLNRAYLESYEARGMNVDELVEETLSTALALGVGTSRATGFGHVFVSLPSGSSA